MSTDAKQLCQSKLQEIFDLADKIKQKWPDDERDILSWVVEQLQEVIDYYETSLNYVPRPYPQPHEIECDIDNDVLIDERLDYKPKSRKQLKMTLVYRGKLKP